MCPPIRQPRRRITRRGTGDEAVNCHSKTVVGAVGATLSKIAGLPLPGMSQLELPVYESQKSGLVVPDMKKCARALAASRIPALQWWVSRMLGSAIQRRRSVRVDGAAVNRIPSSVNQFAAAGRYGMGESGAPGPDPGQTRGRPGRGRPTERFGVELAGVDGADIGVSPLYPSRC